MPMYDYAIKAAFDDAKQDNYQHPVGLDPDMVAAECSDLVDVVDEMFSLEDVILVNKGDDPHEERQMMVFREVLVRTFEAGLAVGLEAGKEGVEVKLFVDRDTVAGLVQQLLPRAVELKE
jgi:hypothetical protein